MSFRSRITENAILEAKVIEAEKKLRDKVPYENSVFEFKSTWPVNEDEYRGWARQLAGHANAARGNSIIWIIGVRDDGEIIGATEFQTDTLMPKLKKHFDQNETPSPLVNIPVNISDVSNSVAAIEFTTDRAPYLIKNKNNEGTEVLWREMSGTRGIRRDELLKLLVPTLDAIRIEPRWGELRLYQHPQQDGTGSLYEIILTVIAYIVPPRDGKLVLPFHRGSVKIFSRKSLTPLTMYEGTNIGSPALHTASGYALASQTIKHSASEAIIDGPGMLRIDYSGNILPVPFDRYLKSTFEIELAEAYTQEIIKFTLEMTAVETAESELIGHWKYPASLSDDMLPSEHEPAAYLRRFLETPRK